MGLIDEGQRQAQLLDSSSVWVVSFWDSGGDFQGDKRQPYVQA